MYFETYEHSRQYIYRIRSERIVFFCIIQLTAIKLPRNNGNSDKLIFTFVAPSNFWLFLKFKTDFGRSTLFIFLQKSKCREKMDQKQIHNFFRWNEKVDYKFGKMMKMLINMF